ncbi:MAG: tetratricopeptide repeat protein [Planctomycetota bacterium]|nr:tetratricopeptide repeat protein [Planctomycetota bacterium]
MADSVGKAKLFSVLLVCYGDYAPYSCRAIASLAQTPGIQDCCDIHVGCNACCSETLASVRENLEKDLITTAIISSRNLHKDPMLRQLIDLARTRYVLLMDDDSHVKPAWLQAVVDFIRKEDPFELAGSLHSFQRSDQYQRMVEQRPWWRGSVHIPPAQRDWIDVCPGGFILARTEFLRRHNFPDRDMTIEFDDVMLADLVHHVGGRLVAMPPQLLSLVAISDGQRRWKSQESSQPSPEARISGPPSRPMILPAAMQLAVTHFRERRLADAESIGQQILQQHPGNANALHLLGMVAHETGRNGLAVELVAKAIAAEPQVPDFQNNFGNILAKLGAFDQAIASFRKAIALRPNYTEAYNNLGNALSQQDKGEEALAAYRKAIELNPRYLDAYGNLGHACRKLGRLDEAAGSFRNVLELAPDHAEAHANLGLALQDQGHLDQAIVAFDKAIELKPDHAQTRLNKALVLLLAGNFKDGWPQYEWRWKVEPNNSSNPRFDQPLWDGSELNDRTILLHCEQGLGSTIQFIRYALLVASRAARVIVECQPPLKSLLSRLSPNVQVLAKGETLPPFDVQVPLMSLPAALRTTRQSIPATVPYLHAEPTLVQKWQAALQRYAGFKVGIAWQGNPMYAGDRQRSIPLKHYRPLAQVPGVHLFSLQKNLGTEQIKALTEPMRLIDLGPQLDQATGPFMDTAAVMKNLDLVITSDTSIAHLAGALGLPVWVALSFAPDWRWLRDRQDCPWYPTMRLFRQNQFGNWPEVLDRIAEALNAETLRIHR